MPRARRDSPELLARVTEAASRGSNRRQLSQWFWDNFETIDAARTSPRMSWVTITQELTKAGFRDADGKPLKKENVRKAFRRAGEAKTAYLAKQRPGEMVVPTSASAVVAASPSMTPTTTPRQMLLVPRARSFKPSQRKEAPDAE